MNNPAQQDPRIYLAAERTFLAWIRTGLGLMGVGFAVSRFGLFLQQMLWAEERFNRTNMTQSTGVSRWLGIVLVSLGVIVLASAALQHISLVRDLSSGRWEPGRSSRNAVVLAVLLSAVGVGMTVFLVILR